MALQEFQEAIRSSLSDGSNALARTYKKIVYRISLRLIYEQNH